MSIDYIPRPLSNIYIPNLPFIPSSLGDIILSYASSICGPWSRAGRGGGGERSLWREQQGICHCHKQKGSKHLPLQPNRAAFTFLPPLSQGVHKLAHLVEKLGVWSSSASPPLSSHPHFIHGRREEVCAWEPHLGAPANVSTRGSHRRGRCWETPFPTCAPGPQHALVLTPPVLMEWRGVWIVSSSPPNHRYPGTGENSQVTWYLGRWSHNLGP